MQISPAISKNSVPLELFYMLRNAVLINRIICILFMHQLYPEDMRGGNINKYACELTVHVFTKFHEATLLDGLISTLGSIH